MRAVRLRQIEFAARGNLSLAIHAGIESGHSHWPAQTFKTKKPPPRLKCDRNLPACGSCLRRGELVACTYASRQPNLRDCPQSSTRDPEQLQRKIDRLERLIVEFVENPRGNSAGSGIACVQTDRLDGSALRVIAPRVHHGDIDLTIHAGQETVVEPDPVSVRTLKIDGHHPKSLSIDEAHWARLLNEIAEVRGHVQTQQKKYDEQLQRISMLMGRTSYDPGPALLFGSSRTASRSEIVSQLPSKYFCDLMVDRYFSTLDPGLYILHQPTFREQYEAYWADPGGQTSIVWIALLFAVLRVAMNDWIREGDEPIEYSGKCHDMGLTFRKRLTDCLLLADYTRPHEYLIEALILHLYSEYTVSRDSKSTTWVLTGMISRLAMRMGYHQENQPSLPMTPFHTEMRRRSWAFVRQADLLFSFQAGLPSMVKTKGFEKSLPLNIYDDHRFHRGCEVVPPPVADTEPTPVSYLLSKTRLAFGFARALKEMNRDEHPSYGRVFEIDQRLRSLYDKVPDFYKIHAIAEQAADPLQVVFSRYVLANLHYKSLCVVHSRYLEVARSSGTYAYSRRVCLESAMTMLRFQAIQNEEILVGGRRRSLTDYQTSLTIHDFLLAATVVSTELCITLRRGRGEERGLDGPTTAEMLKALDSSANIFSQSRDKSIEAYKAGDILGMILKKFQSPLPLSVSMPMHLWTDGTTAGAGAGAGAGSSPTSRSEEGDTAVVDINEAIMVGDDAAESVGQGPGGGDGVVDAPRRSFVPRRLDGHWRVDNALCGPKPTSDEWPPLSGEDDAARHHPPESSSAPPWRRHAHASSAPPTSAALDNGGLRGLFYPSMLDLSDPVSTLWSLSAGPSNRGYGDRPR
ncbi:hypothetical protein PV08_10938 [Exophiala spinifera]|uniref:Xylanolytic transcriptional activator regulatory domain-containing protein n=1 Tax=Exophiala spinifera TaxID=91928 RepID=A0A0D1Y9G5_9EURO|nr:uncharacterized protein PV08_10938 [Exophiala spinifera]KIW11636.1 hypothetical protein PV08_10938 [Exophiala spinifera]